MTRRHTLSVRTTGFVPDTNRVAGATSTTYCLNCGLMTTQIFQAGRIRGRSFVSWRCNRCSYENHRR